MLVFVIWGCIGQALGGSSITKLFLYFYYMYLCLYLYLYFEAALGRPWVAAPSQHRLHVASSPGLYYWAAASRCCYITNRSVAVGSTTLEKSTYGIASFREKYSKDSRTAQPGAWPLFSPQIGTFLLLKTSPSHSRTHWPTHLSLYWTSLQRCVSSGDSKHSSSMKIIDNQNWFLMLISAEGYIPAPKR